MPTPGSNPDWVTDEMRQLLQKNGEAKAKVSPDEILRALAGEKQTVERLQDERVKAFKKAFL